MLPAIPPGLRTVPAFPPVAAKLLTVFASPNLSVRHIGDLLTSDPVFAARILQCANSAEFARLAEITDVRQALMLLGLERVRRVTVSLAAATFLRNATADEDLRRCWRHTVACGILADAIATACGVLIEHAYTAGLLHDIGRLGLLAAYPKEFAKLIRRANETGSPLSVEEQREFGMDHCEAGRYLARRWGLPAIFQTIAGGHHRAPATAELDLLTIVQCACRAADALGFAVASDGGEAGLDVALAPLPTAAAARLAAHPDRLRERIESQLTCYEGGREGLAGAILEPEAEEEDAAAALPLELAPPEAAPSGWFRRLLRLR